jgi:hypothetical protein
MPKRAMRLKSSGRWRAGTRAARIDRPIRPGNVRAQDLDGSHLTPALANTVDAQQRIVGVLSGMPATT